MASIGNTGSLFATTRGRRGLAVASGLILALFAAWPADAVTDAPSDTASDELQEIRVTARKRDESLMSVPVSITAFSARMLEDYDIRSFTDYATKVPNLSFSYGSAASGNAGLGFSTRWIPASSTSSGSKCSRVRRERCTVRARRAATYG
jgi:outer membrane receptor protein involved in Fe transport